MTTTDCGHCCCEIRSNPYHEHVCAPEECRRCLAQNGGTDTGATREPAGSASGDRSQRGGTPR
jgi:hypothetical protein